MVRQRRARIRVPPGDQVQGLGPSEEENVEGDRKGVAPSVRNMFGDRMGGREADLRDTKAGCLHPSLAIVLLYISSGVKGAQLP